jgi:hypothetical protein
LVNYAKNLRNEFGSEVKAVKNEKFINFNSSAKHSKPTLSVPHLIYGVKECTSKIKSKEDTIKLLILFYDERYKLFYLSKHDNFEDLLCSTIYFKTPYILLRDNLKLR